MQTVKNCRANLREIRDHRLAYYNQSNEKELQAEFSDALFKILLLELDEEEEESIEIAELAYLGLGHIFRRPELPTPELYKRRLLLLHYFCDYFTDSIIEVFLSKYREDNILQARSLAIECLEKMQLSDMFYLEENATDFINGDEQLSDACNGIETDPRLSEGGKSQCSLTTQGFIRLPESQIQKLRALSSQYPSQLMIRIKSPFATRGEK